MIEVVERRIVYPRYASPSVYQDSRGPGMVKFGEENFILSKGPQAGKHISYAMWQRWLLGEIFETKPNGGLRYRRGLVGVGRQQGKSIVGSTIALDSLLTGPQGTEVYSAAGDRQQAKIVFSEAKRMIEASELLSKQTKIYRDAIECLHNGGIYRALSADARRQQGLSPQVVVFDEVHVQKNDDLWDALTLGTGARLDPLVIGITTAGEDPDGLAGRLYAYGKKVASGEIDDETFGFWWWEPYEDTAEIDDVNAWYQACPSLYEGIAYMDDMEVAHRQQTPVAFRRYKLNQWRRLGGRGWMDMDVWDRQERTGFVPTKGSDIVVGFDGSVDQDATALIAISVPSDTDLENPVIWSPGIWESPSGDDLWQVPRDEVNGAVAKLFEDYNVVAMGADPAWWRAELQEWAERFGEYRVLDWPVTNARMGPATSSMYARLMDNRLDHDGGTTLRRHISNAVAKDLGPQGITLSKDKRGSSRKIDAAVAGVIAVDMLERFSDNSESGTLLVF